MRGLALLSILLILPLLLAASASPGYHEVWIGGSIVLSVFAPDEAKVGEAVEVLVEIETLGRVDIEYFEITIECGSEVLYEETIWRGESLPKGYKYEETIEVFPTEGGDLWLKIYSEYSDEYWVYTAPVKLWLGEVREKTYSELLDEYSDLLWDYTSLKWDYTSLKLDYEELERNYSALRGDYESLAEEHESLKAMYELLEQRYEQLQEEYKVLESEYNSLLEDYSQLEELHLKCSSELLAARSALYAAWATAVALGVVAVCCAALAAYFWRRSRG